MTDEEIIDKIQSVRAANNVNWMDLVRLALRAAPDEARVIFDRIRERDAELLALSAKLCSGR